jgi:hypothetical protein
VELVLGDRRHIALDARDRLQHQLDRAVIEDHEAELSLVRHLGRLLESQSIHPERQARLDRVHDQNRRQFLHRRSPRDKARIIDRARPPVLEKWNLASDRA